MPLTLAKSIHSCVFTLQFPHPYSHLMSSSLHMPLSSHYAFLLSLLSLIPFQFTLGESSAHKHALFVRTDFANSETQIRKLQAGKGQERLIPRDRLNSATLNDIMRTVYYQYFSFTYTRMTKPRSNCL